MLVIIDNIPEKPKTRRAAIVASVKALGGTVQATNLVKGFYTITARLPDTAPIPASWRKV